MTPIEQAANVAADALRNCDRSETGIVICGIADEYGVDSSALGRELSARRNARRQKKEEAKMTETLWIDMNKVKALGFDGDLGKLARFCNMGHDTLRIVEGRDGKGVQRRTAQKIADTFGVDIKDILHDENRQISLTEVSVASKREQEPASKEEAEIRAAEGKTQGRKGCEQPRINMAFKTDNYEFLVVLARATGTTITGFTNRIIDTFRSEHADLYEKAKAFLEAVNGSMKEEAQT